MSLNSLGNIVDSVYGFIESQHLHLTLNQLIFFVLKIVSTFHVCCVYSSAPNKNQTRFYHQSKH